MSPPAARPYAGAPSSQPIFPDEILGEIFLRLDSAADLARASAVCTDFLRVARYLRRNRSLYRRPVVGFIPIEPPPPPPQPPHPPIHQLIQAQRHPRALHHAEPPHPSASAGRALAELVDLTFSFVPDPTSWRICDAGEGRILLASRTAADLVVCDPLHRRYVRIPPIPDDLTAGTLHRGGSSFLAPAGGEESSFGVIRIVRLNDKVFALAFSAATGEWRRGVTFDGWSGNCGLMRTSCRYHVNVSLYQTSGFFCKVLMLDTRTMEFSVVRVLHHFRQDQAIVEAGDGRIGSLSIGFGGLNLYCKSWEDKNTGGESWQREKTIPLPDANILKYTFIGSGVGYLLLQAIPRDPYKEASLLLQAMGIPRDPSELASSSQGVTKVQYFTLEVKTLLLEKLCVSDKRIDFAHLYANFPLLSLPTV